MARKNTTATPAVAAPPDTLQQFPPHMRLSINEAATCARLVRLMRHRTYWLRYFVEWLLREEAYAGEDLTVEQVEKYVEKMKNLRNWTNYLKAAKAENPAFANHPAMAWIDNDPDDNEEDDIKLLDRMYSLPAPELVRGKS
jgi:hypothetical protein